DTLTLDSVKIANPNVGCFGDIFIVKYDSSGNLLWAKRAGGYGADQANSICTDANGNVYLTGYVHSTGVVDFDTIISAASGSINSVFTAKYNSDGKALWVRYAGSGYA